MNARDRLVFIQQTQITDNTNNKSQQQQQNSLISIRNLPFDSQNALFEKFYMTLREHGLYFRDWYHDTKINFVSFKTENYFRLMRIIQDSGICPAEDIIFKVVKQRCAR
jgi:hypothetical protein